MMEKQDIRDKVIELGLKLRKLDEAGDSSGAEKVRRQIVLVQTNCTHRTTRTHVASTDSRDGRIKKGDLVTWCKVCNKLLKP